jgi:hypothetical protein
VAWPITVSPLAAPSVSFSQQFGLDLGKIESPNAQKQQKIVGDAPTFGLKLVSAGSTLLTNNTLGNISEIQPPDIKATGQLGKVDQIKPQGLAPITTTTATANPATTNPNTSFSIGQTLEVPVSVLPAVLQDLSVYSLSTPNQALLPPGLDIGGIGSPNASILLPPRIEDPNAKDGTGNGIGAIEAPSKGMVPVIPTLPGVGDAKGVGQIEKPKGGVGNRQPLDDRVEAFGIEDDFAKDIDSTNSPEDLNRVYEKYKRLIEQAMNDQRLAKILADRLEPTFLKLAQEKLGIAGKNIARQYLAALSAGATMFDKSGLDTERFRLIKSAYWDLQNDINPGVGGGSNSQKLSLEGFAFAAARQTDKFLYGGYTPGLTPGDESPDGFRGRERAFNNAAYRLGLRVTLEVLPHTPLNQFMSNAMGGMLQLSSGAAMDIYGLAGIGRGGVRPGRLPSSPNDLAETRKMGEGQPGVDKPPRILVYRALRPDENPEEGLTAKLPDRNFPPRAQIVRPTQWISTTKSLGIATNKYTPDEGGVVIVIDTSKLGKNTKTFDNWRWDVFPDAIAWDDAEFLIERRIPADAIIGVYKIPPRGGK